MSWRPFVKWVLRNTVVSRDSLTPNLALRLITEASPAWMSTPDECPFPDPYWAFYWPGGQGMTRFILDHPDQFCNGTVFDFGCGCGSISIASSIVGARHIIANDIDEYALMATRMNFRLNGEDDAKVNYSSKNYITEGPDDFLQSENLTLVLGDMLYDSDFAEHVFKMLKRIVTQKPNTRILIGDPLRHPLSSDYKYDTSFTKIPVAEYPLPGYVVKEHYGFNTAHVFEMQF